MAGSLGYAQFAQYQDNALRSGMDQVINASLCNVVPILRWLAVVYLIVTFVLVASNALTMRAFVGRVVRLGVVVSLIQGGGFYIQHVRDLAFDRVPAEIATVTSGSPTPISAAQQFDRNTARADQTVARILEQNFQWSPKGIANALAAWIALMALKAEIGVMFAVWMLGRKLMAAVLCFGPWLLLTELFDETRGFCKAWVGKIVGLLVFQLASGAAMRIALDGQFYLLTTALDYANLSNVDQAIGTLFQVFAFIISDVFWIIALPAVCAIGSGAAAGHAVATSAIFGAAGGAASAGFQGFRGAFSGSRVARWGRNAIGRGE